MHCRQYVVYDPVLATFEADAEVRWVLAFGEAEAYKTCYPALKQAFPAALVCGCTTAGVIADTRVDDYPLVVTAVRFRDVALSTALLPVAGPEGSEAAGAALAAALPPAGLSHVFLLADGLRINGTALVRGLLSGLPAGVRVTGGMAGDGTRFADTRLFLGGEAHAGAVLAVGLAGPGLRVGHGSLGGWDPFGPDRRITQASGNVLYELDGEPALALYKLYLGEHAKALPASALLFPLALRDARGESVVRTVLSVDEAAGSMTFAGDMPVGQYARLMRANFDRLIDGAATAASRSRALVPDGLPGLAVLISCVGRRLVLGQRIEEEVEAVREVLGPGPTLAGFYSYGEFSPLMDSVGCSLHNQTMTISLFGEA